MSVGKPTKSARNQIVLSRTYIDACFDISSLEVNGIMYKWSPFNPLVHRRQVKLTLPRKNWDLVRSEVRYQIPFLPLRTGSIMLPSFAFMNSDLNYVYFYCDSRMGHWQNSEEDCTLCLAVGWTKKSRVGGWAQTRSVHLVCAKLYSLLFNYSFLLCVQFSMLGSIASCFSELHCEETIFHFNVKNIPP